MPIKQADIQKQDHAFLVTGDINVTNVMSVYRKSLACLRQCPEWQFDFSQLQSTDSSGLALIIEWIKYAKQCRKPIRFTALPQELLSIAKAAGLDNLIVR